MKKYLFVIWLVVISALGMTVYASEELEQEESMTEVFIEDANMYIQLPASYYVLEQEIAEDDAAVAAMELDREKVQNYFTNSQIVLYALSMDRNYELMVTMNYSEDLQYIYRLQSMDQEHVEELMLATKKSYEQNQYEVSSAQITSVGDMQYIIFEMAQDYGAQIVYSKQYYTINDGEIYHITLRSYGSKLSEDMENMFLQVVESIEYEYEHQGIYYENDESGVGFWMASGWKELEMEPAENYIQMQFIHSNGLGESIQFICQDLWGNMDKMQQLMTTRVDIDKRCMGTDETLSEEENQALVQEWLPKYLGNFFADYTKVYEVDYHGVIYYTCDEPMRVTTDGSQDDYLMHTIVTVKNGILYAFRYGYYEEGNLHEGDFIEMLSTIEYSAADMLAEDHQDYQYMIDMVRQAFVGTILIVIVLTTVILFYALGNYEDEQSKEHDIE